MKKQIIGFVVSLMIEQPAKRKGLSKLSQTLQEKAHSLQTRLNNASVTEKNHEKLRHIIAIERWGQNRLNVAFGDYLAPDDNHAYKPSLDTSWEDLKRLFIDVRMDSVALAQQLAESKVDLNQTIPHNDMGDLSVLGWLRYLEVHASIEARSIR